VCKFDDLLENQPKNRAVLNPDGGSDTLAGRLRIDTKATADA
jgi:hypothetical protein